VIPIHKNFNGSQWITKIQGWSRELGFSQIGVAGVDLSTSEPGLSAWLTKGFHGNMAYMAKHGMKRARPAELVPGTVSVITARMDYLPRASSPDWIKQAWTHIDEVDQGVISIYARGRDYHKVLRNRLNKLSERLKLEAAPLGYRVFTDSAPILEVELAKRSGLGWRGKHTLLLNREAGSMFFLGEIFIDMPLPETSETSDHCGTCKACMEVCPTNAIVAPYQLDARRCISYLTIEHAGPIPVELRSLIGNRIYGCDDCQLVCPWNKYAQRSALPDFDEREGLVGKQLLVLWQWQEQEFKNFTEGSPIRRIGYERWLRNISVALGNALRELAKSSSTLKEEESFNIRKALSSRLFQASPLLSEHIQWAITQGLQN